MRGAWSPEVRPAHVPKERGSEFTLVSSVLVKPNIVSELIRSGSKGLFDGIRCTIEPR